MDIKALSKGIVTKFEKYKFVVLIIVIGIVLMMLPDFGEKEAVSEEKTVSQPENLKTVQEELKEILSLVRGAGKVEIMLKEREGEEKIYQYNEDRTVSENATSTKIDVVTIADDDRNENGLIRKTIPATYMGAIVLCQGADDPVVKLAVAEAVAKITGLGMDKIVVLKMK